MLLGSAWRARLTAGLAGAALTVTALASLVALSTDARPGDVLYGVKRGTEQTQLALAGDDRDAEWTAGMLHGRRLAAPSLLGFECANILRRHELAALIEPGQAAQAHRDLLDLAARMPVA